MHSCCSPRLIVRRRARIRGEFHHVERYGIVTECSNRRRREMATGDAARDPHAVGFLNGPPNLPVLAGIREKRGDFSFAVRRKRMPDNNHCHEPGTTFRLTALPASPAADNRVGIRRNLDAMLFNSYTFLLFFLPCALLAYSGGRCVAAAARAVARAALPAVLRLVEPAIRAAAGGFDRGELGGGAQLRGDAAARHHHRGDRGGPGTARRLQIRQFLYRQRRRRWPARAFRPLDIVLPLGISFFTFHHIMYLVDLRRGRAPLAPFDRYALYICFFPQAIAVRWRGGRRWESSSASACSCPAGNSAGPSASRSSCSG